ncbi:MAG: hypothetical protein IPP46_06160 [Bacteroidetes bacterium]|nr:hypothetical protein [Bacteroidota bacterium]
MQGSVYQLPKANGMPELRAAVAEWSRYVWPAVYTWRSVGGVVHVLLSRNLCNINDAGDKVISCALLRQQITLSKSLWTRAFEVEGDRRIISCQWQKILILDQWCPLTCLMFSQKSHRGYYVW